VTGSSDILLGDLARAFNALVPANALTRDAIAKLLGFERLAETSSTLSLHSEPSEVEPPETMEPKMVSDQAAPPRDEKGERDMPMPTRPTRAQLEPTASTSIPTKIAAWKEVGPLATFHPEKHLQGITYYDPLFTPHWTRGIVAASLATRASTGLIIDLSQLLDTIARGRPIRGIFHISRPSLSRGVQILVDISEGMQPFARDQMELMRVIQGVVGIHATAILQFRSCPTRKVGVGPVWTWRGYQPPQPGTPVLLLTDLGIGGPSLRLQRSRTEEWQSFARTLSRHSCPLVAFVPYPPERWPTRLMQEMIILQWDRATTFGTVRKAIGPWHEV
jgi:hypothetical protein